LPPSPGTRLIRTAPGGRARVIPGLCARPPSSGVDTLERVARSTLLSTRVLLVCAAIGVATGIVGGIAGLLTPVVLIAAPFAYGLLLGAHVLPGIVAQEVLRLPLVALLSHVMAALVASAFNPAWAPRFIGTALLFGGIQEGVAALTRYRSWGAWRFFASAVIIGVLIAAVVFFAVDLGTLPAWAQVAYLVLSVLAPVGWTALALAVGTGLRRAGVARPTRPAHSSR
jgi:energy-coupling factor transport system substrate-specific component